MAYVGNLRQYSFGEVLRLIGDGMRRGRIVVERAGLRADLYCDNGYLLHVWRSGTSLPLAQRWLNSRFITPTQLAQLVAVAGTDLTQMTDADCARLAVERMLVTAEMLMEWAMSDAVDLLAVLLAWPDGDYRFEDGFAAPAIRLIVPLAIPTVLGMTMQRMGALPAPVPNSQPMPPANHAMPINVDVHLDNVLDFADLDPNDPVPVQLTRDQWRVLTLVDGESTLAAIAQNLATAAPNALISDQQRYFVELRRNEELVVRVAAELVSEGIAVIFGQPMGEPAGRRWAPGA